MIDKLIHILHMKEWFSGRFYSFAALRANLKTARNSRIWQLQLILHYVGLYPHEREA